MLNARQTYPMCALLLVVRKETVLWILLAVRRETVMGAFVGHVVCRLSCTVDWYS